ncbi:hypothetical protein EDC01DRAFT_781590 [Geopyxis carbonaria]|nr:hypothetical protein EDC01DRAFT_781590 [Geopyxis carbonaria]
MPQKRCIPPPPTSADSTPWTLTAHQPRPHQPKPVDTSRNQTKPAQPGPVQSDSQTYSPQTRHTPPPRSRLPPYLPTLPVTTTTQPTHSPPPGQAYIRHGPGRVAADRA